MRETSFIKQNQEKWKEFEDILKRRQKDPDKLNKLFVQITDDLSFSRTFYPNRSVRVYLNNLAQQIFQSIYTNKKSRRARLISFWTDELPQLVYESRQAFRLSFFLFLIAFAIGVLSSAMDIEFPRVILGDAYVDMTLENIESGDPMKVYKEKGEFSMSMGITINNLWVAFLTFILGVFFAIGSAFIIVKNAIMVGAFQYFFYEKGVFLESFLTIWTHGTLEISAIIIAGAAGMTMGRGLLFPGTYSRLQAFQVSARRGLKIMLGITPIIIMAGFIEGYLTRYTETPDIISAAFIFICLAFVLFYFVWYPWRKSKTGFRSRIKDAELPAEASQQIQYTGIKSTGEIFADVFSFFKKYLRQLSLGAMLASALFCALCYGLAETDYPESLFGFSRGLFFTPGSLPQFFSHQYIWFLPIINVVLYGGMIMLVYYYMFRDSDDEHFISRKWTQHLGGFVQLAALTFALQYIMTLDLGLISFLLIIFVYPLLLLSAFVLLKEGGFVLKSIGRSLQLLRGNFGRALSLYLLLSCLGFLFLSIADSTLLWLFVEVVSINFLMEESNMQLFVNILLSFSTLFILMMTFKLFVIAGGLLYHSLLEIVEAPELKSRIQTIGSSRSIRGLEREN
ncbi:MAG: stage II sporulation protein M [Bacteroidota bacterium]